MRLGAIVFYDSLTWLGRRVEHLKAGRQTQHFRYIHFKKNRFITWRNFWATSPPEQLILIKVTTSHFFRYAEVILNYAEALNEMNRVEDAVTK